MCLFTNDPTAPCNHVECNLVKTIQMQNPQIFPHMIHSTNVFTQNHQQNNISSIDQSDQNQSLERCSVQNDQMIEQNHHPKNHYIKQEHKQKVNQHSKKQNINLNHKAQNHQQNHQNNQQFSTIKNKDAQANCRIAILQKQVSILQNGMKNLIDSLKQKNILSQQEYQIQYNFLQQIQDLSKLIPSPQNQQNNKN